MNKTSLKKLATAHADLQLLAYAVNKIYPIQVICGERGEVEQNEAFREGKSELSFPESKHNINYVKGRFKSHAIDIIPDPDKNPATVNWKDKHEFEKMCLIVEQVADDLSIKIRMGKFWGDFPHIELA